ncbi:MAG TPA: methyltransferase domain-containing protein [Vicinamibacterales bacterium]|nr:methyltransferase domain-containing protein [Vicinamibacterales bacterium]
MKSAVNRLLAVAGLEVRGLPDADRDQLRRAFDAGGRVPWSPGYRHAKSEFIERALQDTALLEAFRSNFELPPAYGTGLDERCVEYPWLFSQLSGVTGPILDAGSVFNHAYLLRHLPFDARYLHILTLAPESECHWQAGISYLFADLRSVPIRGGHYDVVACISTLEHVGFDNSALSGRNEHREVNATDFVAVMRELSRVLKPGGTLYLTVPYGVARRFAGFQQFDGALLETAIGAFEARRDVHLRFFRYGAGGWRTAAQSDCDDAQFADWIPAAARGEATSESVDGDRVAAARAVACVRIRKAGPGQ